MTRKERVRLIQKYLEGTASETEKAQLNSWYYSFDQKEMEVHVPAETEDQEMLLERRLWRRLQQVVVSDTPMEKSRQPVVVERAFWPRYRIAAAVVLGLLLSGGWWLWHKPSVQQLVAQQAIVSHRTDVPPGGSKALLILADGSKVDLDETKAGALPQQGKTKLAKRPGGQLVYHQEPADRGGAPAISYNTLLTPRGGQYRLTLPDGSKVWLNSASALRYPVAFSGKERVVELTGEAYFDIAKHNGQPFHVKVRGTDVTVLGTQFNIMAYDDAATIQTTLLAGAVKVTKADQSCLLMPGQQAEVPDQGKIYVNREADTAAAISWKKGLFQFSSANITEVMQQIARWYNVDVVYGDSIPDGRISGKMPMNTSLSEVLKVLKLNGIDFEVAGDKVIVQPTRKKDFTK